MKLNIKINIIFILIILFINQFKSEQLNDNKNLRYGIIVDAGSTQTRLYIYQFHGPSNASYSPYVEPALLPNSNQQARFIQDGSISDLKKHQIPDFFRGMLDFAKSYIPKEKQKFTSFHILATAGVRVLGFKKIEKLVDKISDYFIQMVDFPFKLDENFGIQVLPGEFEGAYDWLTVNYLAGTLERKSIQESIISIDFGGASLELTFEPTERLSEDSFPLRVNETDRILYTQSYLRFGRNQALLRHRETLARKLKIKDPINDQLPTVFDPCFPFNYREKIKLKLDDKKYKFWFLGTGNFSLCQILTLNLLRKNVFCAAEPCAMNGKHQPTLPSGRPIYALDGFSKLGRLLGCSSQTTLACLEQRARLLCPDSTQFSKASKSKLGNGFRIGSLELTLEEIQKYSAQSSECFLAAYGINVLKHGFGIDLYRKLYLQDDYKGISIGWTLGAMIYQLEIESFRKGYCVEPEQNHFKVENINRSLFYNLNNQL